MDLGPLICPQDSWLAVPDPVPERGGALPTTTSRSGLGGARSQSQSTSSLGENDEQWKLGQLLKEEEKKPESAGLRRGERRAPRCRDSG